ncbi:MAG: NAD(P)-dependent oxidoreductase [Yoonia sp.]|uniref:NAD(P)-dependent oxidoreductase n=1 Tax=Yoonia sp. TaxID=2212373 RepID=UPI003EFA2886
MENIGVIGLGRMGSAIAQRFQDQGHNVCGWTRSGRTVEGVKSAPDLGTLVQDSDTLILSLLDDAAVIATLDAVLAHDLTGKQIIETSTVVPQLLQDRIAAIHAKGATAVDAPISGGPEMVAAGTCGIFIGGDPEAATRAQTSLAAISARIFHVGPLGSGLVMKTINNGMLQCYVSGLCEMMPLAKRAGLALESVMQIVSGGPAGTPMVADRLPKVFGTDDTVGFAISDVRKDNDVFRRVVQSYGLATPVLDQSAVPQDSAIADGHGAEDVARLITLAYTRG